MTSFLQVYIHAVWSTKYRQPILTRDQRPILLDHITTNARSKGIYIDTIGGYIDHVHCLFRLGKEQTIAKTIQLIKGESAYWANKQKLIKPSLRWQEEYYAGSVDYKSIQSVRNYIINQEQHHAVKTFDEEYNKLTIIHGIDGAKAPGDVGRFIARS